ncbi:kinase-like protein [Choiromyces venosus 120613-1]|uniref:cyclin-dependent kinase n=1 Tax=Choiromyces venosus 120613-1 TaxID=1336337 RepID=A0A3N4JHP8_9PEZI|nr:kinase-like protein [Choiromyces venosus 120613-1]
MSTKTKSRWDDDTETTAAELARLKAEKAARKALKSQQKQKQRQSSTTADNDNATPTSSPASKRRKLGRGDEPNIEAGGGGGGEGEAKLKLLRFNAPAITPCAHVDRYEKLNHIEEGSYGVVSRARDSRTGEIVALKRLKLERETDGFPITSLREIQTLMAARHENVVNLREVVVGGTLKDVFIVMDFIEHDLKTLSEDMQEPFLQSEVKTLMLQLVSATALMHSQWIVHRDLKTSNLLMNNRGQIKVADFGLARYIGDPMPPLTQLVVTLWYRSPELLLGAKEYGTAVDMWSIGCIFGELLLKDPLLKGKNEVDQLSKIFDLCGTPTDTSWPTFRKFPNARSLKIPKSNLPPQSKIRTKFPLLTSLGIDLISRLLALDPAQRISAEEVLKHPYFKEDPRPKSAEMFPTFPSKAGQEKRRRRDSPSAPARGGEAPSLGDLGGLFGGREEEAVGAGFSLRMGR